jgi:hypothetical protein
VDEPECGSGDTQGQWRRQNPGLVGTNIPAFWKPALPAEDQYQKKSVGYVLMHHVYYRTNFSSGKNSCKWF